MSAISSLLPEASKHFNTSMTEASVDGIWNTTEDLVTRQPVVVDHADSSRTTVVAARRPTTPTATDFEV